MLPSFLYLKIDGVAQPVCDDTVTAQNSNARSDQHLTHPSAQGIVIVRWGNCEDTVTSDCKHEIHIVKVQMPEQKHNKTERRDQRSKVPPRSRINRIKRQQHCE